MAIELRFITYTQSAPEYNCSAYSSQEWTDLFGKRRPLLGYWSIGFALMCQILYIPSLRIFYDSRKTASFKIMWFLALADMGGLTCVGTLFGYAMVRGMVFCSDPILSWTIGCAAYCFWCVSTCSCALLVINRICEMLKCAWLLQARIVERLLKGWRCVLFMTATVAYGVIGALFTRQVFPNSAHGTLAFDPFIPGHNVDEYPNTANMIHNMCVAVVIPCLYIVLCASIRNDFSRFNSFSAVQIQQAKVFTQASIICIFNASTAMAWILQMFLTMPQIAVTGGMITIQCVHGLPCIIYIVLNRKVRDEFRRMIGIKKRAAVDQMTTLNLSATPNVR